MAKGKGQTARAAQPRPSDHVRLLLKVEAGTPRPRAVAEHVHHLAGDDVRVREACVVSSKVDVLAIVEGPIAKVGRVAMALMAVPVPSKDTSTREAPAPPDEVHRFFLGPEEVVQRPVGDIANAYVDVKVLPGQKEQVAFRLRERPGKFLRSVWSIENRERLLLHVAGKSLGELHAYVLDEVAPTEGVCFTRTYDCMRSPPRPAKRAPPALPAGMETLLMIECGAPVGEEVVQHVRALLPFAEEERADRPHGVLVSGAPDVFAWTTGSVEEVGERLLRLMRSPLPSGVPPFAVHAYAVEPETPLPRKGKCGDEAIVFLDVTGQLPDRIQEQKRHLVDVLATSGMTDGRDIELHGLRRIADRPRVLAHFSYRKAQVLRDRILAIHALRDGDGRLVVARTMTHMLLARPIRRPTLKLELLERLRQGPARRADINVLVKESDAAPGTKKNIVSKLKSEELVEEYEHAGEAWLRLAPAPGSLPGVAQGAR